MNILIITGGSKGIGKALAEKYTSEKYHVFSIARSLSNSEKFTEIKADLSAIKEVPKALKSIFNQIDKERISSITLLNNAGRLGEISTLENLDPEDIAKSIQLNTTTPLVLSNLFIKETQNWNCKKQIINISSGAATKPYEGWSVYCTSKAALDMTTKAIAAEQSEIENGVKCVAIYPGVVDTNMQNQIRKTNKADFKNVQRFKDLKENNELYSSEFVAEKIYSIDIENQLQSGDIIDIRNF
ncbi:hypothetical protein BTO04_00150 [Polaribacter sp. SA4-10]|uniref:(S)-benzoin forming benzil reductase n=1 Tax=Polaribacter sp. SA4-10 TaxID=754397 RepID=UPI000B3D0913|nr:(S)-benzoin forming benzil reductase [Polaribacter sp. SA4-10]ARV05199.1 hypothetical protein BTO04_00150 [Polaribacter sp. SA4-10]